MRHLYKIQSISIGNQLKRLVEILVETVLAGGIHRQVFELQQVKGEDALLDMEYQVSYFLLTDLQKIVT